MLPIGRPGSGEDWPAWMVEYIERKIKESPDGVFRIERLEEEPRFAVFAKQMGAGLVEYTDGVIMALLEEKNA